MGVPCEERWGWGGHPSDREFPRGTGPPIVCGTLQEEDLAKNFFSSLSSLPLLSPVLPPLSFLFFSLASAKELVLLLHG